MNKLNLFCPINGTGYGITSANIALQLEQLNLDVALFVLGQGVMLQDPIEREAMLKMLNASRSYDPYAPCLKIWHQNDLGPRIGVGDYYVFPFFEADKLHDFEVRGLNHTTGVFTASKWGKKVLEDNGVKVPVFVAPLGVNTEIFNNEKSLKIKTDKYVFLHVGKWEKRKGQDFLLQAFEKAFSPDDNVELWLVPHNPFLSPQETNQWLNLVNNNALSDKIKVYNRLPTQQDLAEVIRESDCGIFMSRAEGWNNEIPEMMALNKPIITTNYSAHTEYCNQDNSFLVEINETEAANDGKWFHGFGNWAKLGKEQLEQTVEHMKFVYNNKVRSNEKGLETARHYSWSNTASIINNTLTERKSYSNAIT
jgi:glycosyltransferase involved in cell wall biosynthesis